MMMMMIMMMMLEALLMITTMMTMLTMPTLPIVTVMVIAMMEMSAEMMMTMMMTAFFVSAFGLLVSAHWSWCFPNTVLKFTTWSHLEPYYDSPFVRFALVFESCNIYMTFGGYMFPS